MITTQWFGRRPPEGTTVLAMWGARAILAGRGSRQAIDIVPDRRQAWTPNDQPPPEAFKAFVSEKVAPWLDRNCDAGWIEPGGDELLFIEDGPFRAEASAQRSHGYLYIGAWMTGPASETVPAPA